MVQRTEKKDRTLFLPILATVSISTVVLVARALRRQRSLNITAKFECECGKIQGRICAKKEDSIRITCFCGDCREYASFVASQGGKIDKTVGEYGDSRVVQVCKSDFVITKGLELMRLARKAPNEGMYRYYSGCCSVPLCNTVKSLGFVGVFMDFLSDEKFKYDGPVSLFPDQALEKPDQPLPNINVKSFLWKLIRYAPYSHSGPLDYNLEPKYWGKHRID